MVDGGSLWKERRLGGELPLEEVGIAELGDGLDEVEPLEDVELAGDHVHLDHRTGAVVAGPLRRQLILVPILDLGDEGDRLLLGDAPRRAGAAVLELVGVEEAGGLLDQAALSVAVLPLDRVGPVADLRLVVEARRHRNGDRGELVVHGNLLGWWKRTSLGSGLNSVVEISLRSHSLKRRNSIRYFLIFVK